MEIPEINSRISQIIDYKSNGSRKKFAESIGVAQQTINRLFNLDTRTKKYPVATTDIIVAATEMFVDVNARWLLTGKGSMLKSDEKIKGSIGVVPSAPQQSSTDIKNITIDKLIKEVKELSAENAVLKLENERLIKDIKNKSNPRPYSYVAEP